MKVKNEDGSSVEIYDGEPEDVGREVDGKQDDDA